MGGKNWSCTVPYEGSAEASFTKHKQEIASHTLDWQGNIRFSKVPMLPGFDGDINPANFLTVFPLSDEELIEFFETTQPGIDDIEGTYAVWEWLDRGIGCYVVAYEGSTPKQVVFMGYSFD